MCNPEFLQVSGLIGGKVLRVEAVAEHISSVHQTTAETSSDWCSKDCIQNFDIRSDTT